MKERYTMGRIGNWLHTHTGTAFYPLDPREDEVHIEDIAHALSHQCRFAGHTTEFYSVAQHSVLVSLICAPEDALWGLMHDGPEAYVVDVPRPVKQGEGMDGYHRAESAIMAAICRKWGLSPSMPDSVKLADDIALVTEARDLVGNPKWAQEMAAVPLSDPTYPMDSRIAKHYFMERFYQLTGTRRP
jgi:5'-deoxynucleotidase YfbR-like HD superfamily hydrolase